MNTKLSVGDRIRLLDMHDENQYPLGATGTVTSIVEDPFEPDNEIVSVKWDQGFSLSLLTKYDKWKVIKTKITEETKRKSTGDPHVDFLLNNSDLKKCFDLDYFLNYLAKLRNSGIENMLGVKEFMYMDENNLERFYGLGREDNDDFQDLLEIQNETRDKFISGLIKFAEKNNIPLEDDNKINNLARRLSGKILEFYLLFYKN